MRPDREWWQTPPAEPVAAGWTVGVVGACSVYLVVASRVDGAVQVLAALAVTAVALGITQAAGLSADDLGMARSHVVAGLRWGVAIGAAVVVAVAVAAVLPGVRSFFEDDRYAGASGSEVIFDALVRIPVGTALFEEVLFRGVLLGLLLRQLRPTSAVAVSAALFGLWHVAAALGFADANAGVPEGATGVALVVPVTVVVTGMAGVVLAWLRIRSGSVLAPVLVHAAVNSSALVAAWFVTG